MITLPDIQAAAARISADGPTLLAVSGEDPVRTGMLAGFLELAFGRDPELPPAEPGDLALAVFPHEIRVARIDGSVSALAAHRIGSVHSGRDRWGRDCLVLPRVGGSEGPVAFLVGREILRRAAGTGIRSRDPLPLLVREGLLEAA